MTDEKLKDPAADHDRTEELVQLLADDDRTEELVQLFQAYQVMISAGHLPVKWGLEGEAQVSLRLLHTPRRAAVIRARAFHDQMSDRSFFFGGSHREANRAALVWAIEAARALACGAEGNGRAAMLMRMAIEQIEEAKKAE